jgi:hypothetical protein
MFRKAARCIAGMPGLPTVIVGPTLLRLADPAVATAAWTVRTQLEIAESYALRRRHVELVRNQFRSGRSLEPDTRSIGTSSTISGWDRDRLLALYWLNLVRDWIVTMTCH